MSQYLSKRILIGMSIWAFYVNPVFPAEPDWSKSTVTMQAQERRA